MAATTINTKTHKVVEIGKMTAVGGTIKINAKNLLMNVTMTTDAHIVLVGTIVLQIVRKGKRTTKETTTKGEVLHQKEVPQNMIKNKLFIKLWALWYWWFQV